MSPLAWLGFLLAAAAGAVTRFLVDEAVSQRAGGVFPWGTLVINVTGCFVLGVLTGLALYHALPRAVFPKSVKVILGTGFCGAYTTFSTFSYETVRLLEEGAVNTALRNVAASLLAGAAAAALGLALTAL
jgi:CrcB protein